jgi:hypothetical protein
MGDFRTQFISKTIPSTGGVGTLNSITAQAPADFTALDDINAGCLITACTQNTAGIGFTTGTFNNGLCQVNAAADFDDADSITFQSGYLAAIGRTDLCGVQLLEYTGPGNGINAMVVRADLNITLGAGVTTIDSAAISGIVTLGKCVPFGQCFCDANTGEYRAELAKWDVINNGTNNVVRVTRALGTGSMTVRVRVVEFVGVNWSVQKVSHTFAASATNEDAAISAVVLANTFTYSTFEPTGGQTQAEINYFVWLSSTTNLRHRVTTKSGTAQSCITWVISNPQLNVATYGTIDGTAEYTAAGGNPDTVNITITAVPDILQTLVLGYAGSSSTGTTSVTSGWWLHDLTTTTNLRMRRSGSATAANRGDTEWFMQVIDFSGVASTRIDSVDTITDGAAFSIHGLFSPGSTVTHGGDVVAVGSQTTSAINCTGSIGTKAYGDPYPLIVTDTGGGTDSASVPIAPVAGTSYANLSGNPASSAVRLTAIPDLTGVEQIRWLSSDVAGVAMTGADVEVLANAVLRYHPAVTSAKFAANAKDGGGWGAAATQTFAQAVVAVPTLNTPQPDLQVTITTSQQINLAQNASGWTSLSIIGSLPTGLVNTNGIITGSPTQLGVFALTTRYTNSSGNTDDAWVLTVVDLPTSLTFRVNTQFLDDNTAVPLNSVFKGGAAFNSTTGAQYVANWPSNGKVVYTRGVAYRQDGAMTISTGGSRAVSPRGHALTSRGELIVTTADSTGYSAGLPITQTGAVCITDAGGGTTGGSTAGTGFVTGTGFGTTPSQTPYFFQPFTGTATGDTPLDAGFDDYIDRFGGERVDMSVGLGTSRGSMAFNVQTENNAMPHIEKFLPAGTTRAFVHILFKAHQVGGAGGSYQIKGPRLGPIGGTEPTDDYNVNPKMRCAFFCDADGTCTGSQQFQWDDEGGGQHADFGVATQHFNTNWVGVEFYAALNTVGSADGIVQLFADNVQQGLMTNAQPRTSSAVELRFCQPCPGVDAASLNELRYNIGCYFISVNSRAHVFRLNASTLAGTTSPKYMLRYTAWSDTRVEWDHDTGAPSDYDWVGVTNDAGTTQYFFQPIP